MRLEGLSDLPWVTQIINGGGRVPNAGRQRSIEEEAEGRIRVSVIQNYFNKKDVKWGKLATSLS